jgi:hypothetical protein
MSNLKDLETKGFVVIKKFLSLEQLNLAVIDYQLKRTVFDNNKQQKKI